MVALVNSAQLDATELSEFSGTIDVKFMPLQSGGIKQGCSLVFNVVGQDHIYRQGQLVSLIGNITFSSDKLRKNAGLSLKLRTIMSLQREAKTEEPFVAYIQTPNGSTANDKPMRVVSPDTPGAVIFVYGLGDGVMTVLKDILDGQPVTIGFNRNKDGLDVLVPLDLTVAETTASNNGLKRRHSEEMLLQFATCNLDVANQVQKQLEEP